MEPFQAGFPRKLPLKVGVFPFVFDSVTTATRVIETRPCCRTDLFRHTIYTGVVDREKWNFGTHLAGVSHVFNLSIWFWIGVAVSSAIAGLVFCLRASSTLRERAVATARAQFYLRREWLEAEFVKLAGLRGIPRGLIWVDCDFDNDVQFARDRNTGQLRALVSTTIRFEAVEGGGMEDVEAVGNLRAATAIFFYEGKKWSTNGRALFNLNPVEAIQHYRHELEMVDEAPR